MTIIFARSCDRNLPDFFIPRKDNLCTELYWIFSLPHKCFTIQLVECHDQTLWRTSSGQKKECGERFVPWSIFCSFHQTFSRLSSVFFTRESGYSTYNEAASNANKHFKARSSAQLSSHRQTSKKQKSNNSRFIRLPLFFLQSPPDCLRFPWSAWNDTNHFQLAIQN